MEAKEKWRRFAREIRGCRVLAVFLGKRYEAAKAIDEGGKPMLMLFTDRSKFEAESGCWMRVTDDGLCGDFALLNQEMEFGFGLGGKLAGSFKEQAARAKVSNA